MKHFEELPKESTAVVDEERGVVILRSSDILWCVGFATKDFNQEQLLPDPSLIGARIHRLSSGIRRWRVAPVIAPTEQLTRRVGETDKQLRMRLREAMLAGNPYRYAKHLRTFAEALEIAVQIVVTADVVRRFTG